MLRVVSRRLSIHCLLYSLIRIKHRVVTFYLHGRAVAPVFQMVIPTSTVIRSGLRRLQGLFHLSRPVLVKAGKPWFQGDRVNLLSVIVHNLRSGEHPTVIVHPRLFPAVMRLVKLVLLIMLPVLSPLFTEMTKILTARTKPLLTSQRLQIVVMDRNQGGGVSLRITLLNIQGLISKTVNKLDSSERKHIFDSNDIVLLTETWSSDLHNYSFNVLNA